MRIRNKLIISLIICILTSAWGFSQRFYSGFGVGGQMTTAKYKDSFGVSKSTSSKYGFRAYWMGRVNLEGNIFFSPEVGYTLKGFTVKSPEAGVAEQEIVLHYFEVKLLQEYTFNEKFFIKVGPSISGAITGNMKSLSTTGLRSNSKLPFNFGAWGRFEACINICGGIHFGNGWIAELALSDGLSSIYDGDDGPKVKNRLVGLSIGKYLR